MNKFYLAILGALITGMIIFSVWITTTSFISSETNPTIADKEEKEENPYAYQKVPENFKIAFIGDQG
ncbi:MAG: hypothetical protein GWN01_04570, partial [Nitrosopumilaceae archaeon]|nr:hypothetical protein [Nitrosopumilaceae archaeon]NIU86631.1 hypothetical protein [Nitrosopumilaceae archaeon]NIV65330.1 hypothetical protein [Nitrosopumilaceae archaeon]NIX60821.1 hypothetical protein [Nitrosopumilaceae archaeon]